MGNCCSQSKKVSATPKLSDDERPSSRGLHSYVSFQTFFNTTENPLICEWEFKTEFGKGAMSRVYQVENTETKEISAAKVYNLLQLNKQTLRTEPPPMAAVQNELDIIMMLDHRYILSFIEAIEDQNTQSLIIFTPFAQYGNVQDIIDSGRMTPDMVVICFHQIAVGMTYLHSKNIVHRDIKNENFLSFDSDYYVLSDFSVSKILEFDGQMLDDTKGSPAFLSPEECSGEAFNPKPADVWAYGVSLYIAVFHKLPFKLDDAKACPIANTVLMVTQQLENEELEFPEDETVDPSAIELLTLLLKKDPKERPAFDEICQHHFFRKAWKIDEKNAAEDAIAIQNEGEAVEENQDAAGDVEVANNAEEEESK